MRQVPSVHRSSARTRQRERDVAHAGVRAVAALERPASPWRCPLLIRTHDWRRPSLRTIDQSKCTQHVASLAAAASTRCTPHVELSGSVQMPRHLTEVARDRATRRRYIGGSRGVLCCSLADRKKSSRALQEDSMSNRVAGANVAPPVVRAPRRDAVSQRANASDDGRDGPHIGIGAPRPPGNTPQDDSTT